MSVLRVNPSTGTTTKVATMGGPGSYDITTGDVSDQVMSIQDQTGAVNLGTTFTDFIVSAGLAFAGPAPSITPDSIKADVRGALDSGDISNAGVATSLQSELDNAEAARSRGQCATAGNIYRLSSTRSRRKAARRPPRRLRANWSARRSS